MGPSTGGIGRHVTALADFLLAEGHQVTTCGPAETLRRFAPPGRWVEGLTLRRFRSACAGADVVHAHGIRAGALTGLALDAALPGTRRPPLVVTWHNLVGTGGRVGTVAQRYLARRATVSLCVSPDLVEHVGSCGGQPRLAPIGAARRQPSGRPLPEVRAELGVSPGQQLVLAVGRLHQQKGLDVLVRAVAGLSGVRLVLVGDGPERGALERLGQQLGLGDRLTITGWTDSPRSWLPALDVMALPSRFEGLPLVLLEAMHAGLPVVSTPVGSVADALVDGETGLLVPTDDVPALQAALGTLLADSTRRSAMGAAARERARRRFSADAMAAAYEEVYDEILASSGSLSPA